VNKCDGLKTGLSIDNGRKKSFEVPRAREKVKETRNPKPGVKKKTCKVKVDRVKKSYGASRITT
jgi:hypothetical protein